MSIKGGLRLQRITSKKVSEDVANDPCGRFSLQSFAIWLEKSFLNPTEMLWNMNWTCEELIYSNLGPRKFHLQAFVLAAA